MKLIIIFVAIFTITPLPVIGDLIDFEAFSDHSNLTSNDAVKVHESILRLIQIQFGLQSLDALDKPENYTTAGKKLSGFPWDFLLTGKTKPATLNP